MLDRLWKSGLSEASFRARARKTSERSSCRPLVEPMENRRLMTASLAPISNISVPALLGYQLTLDGSGTTDNQSFTATSSNPDIKVSVATGPFWTVTVSHSPSSSSDVTITNESMTFQLFNDLTPNTVSRIETLSNGTSGSSGNFYTSSAYGGPGKYIPRITNTASSGFSIIQGGSTSATSTSSSSTLTPFIDTEPVQQLAFTGQYQLAMANTGSPTSTDAQFFITNGTLSTSTQQSFDFNYTIFGQLVSGQQTVTDLGKVVV
ncbi:MAG TPA: peptidylprolyl isomerase, partial [Isosphaeraceae bacterium]|nr:peptidylprolyl isomerase [Isosphaeraceae bacterium]